MKNNKKKLAWITPRCFVETDIYAIESLALDYEIDWFIIDPSASNEYSERINALLQCGVNVKIMLLPGRNRSLRTLKFYWNLLLDLKSGNYDLYYNAIFGIPFYMPLEKILLPNKKIIIALHNVTTPKGAKSSSILSKLYTYFVSRSFSNYHTFSHSQCSILQSIAKQKNVFNIPFFLKDYGTSKNKPSEEVSFLFFGQILEYKRLDVLIQAAENVFEKLQKPFKVKIAGSCPFWHKYETLIKHKDIFDLTIRRIANEEIPDLFASSHYFMMPYQDIAQSGAVIVAINYELPVIVSKLPAFEEYIKNDYNGFLMKPADVVELESIMINILMNHKSLYPRIKSGMLQTKKESFSNLVIKKRYIDEFAKIISDNE